MPILYGDQQDNYLYGSYGDDLIRGYAGNDHLQGADGNDTLSGGAGDDLLDGGQGNDTYLFSRGDGQDRIEALDGAVERHDTVLFGASIAPEDIRLERTERDLILRIAGTGDALTIVNFFDDDWYGNAAAIRPFGIDAFVFSDGTSWDIADLMAQLRPVAQLSQFDDNHVGGSADGKDGDDQLLGSEDDDLLIGGAGNDTLNGWAGNDILIGGSGDDTMMGGQGANTYRFGANWGKDTIMMSGFGMERITQLEFDTLLPGSLAYSRSEQGAGPDLILSLRDGSDSVTLKDFFTAADKYGLRIRFADRSLADWSDIETVLTGPAPILQVGSGANDTLYGGYERDHLRGEGGDDILDGQDGDDTLAGGEGNDNLRGGYNDDVLDGGDGIDFLSGDEGADRLDGGAGDDMLYGGNGNDLLDGGAGNDVLDGGAGSNVIVFGPASGRDTLVTMPGASNTILFDASVRPEDIFVRREGDYRIIVTIHATMAEISFPIHADWDQNGQVLSTGVGLRFADGSAWVDALSYRNIIAGDDFANHLYGTEGGDVIDGKGGDDFLDGYIGDDRLLGGDGHDMLHGFEGDDVLTGGTGDDRLDVGRGSNIIHYARGDGFDTLMLGQTERGADVNSIVFGAGIAPEDIVVMFNDWGGGAVLELRIRDVPGAILVQDFRVAGMPDAALAVRFANGERWDTAQLLGRPMLGDEGNNSLIGSEQADTIDGRGGDDSLVGQGGDDALLGGAGHDWLDGGLGHDTLRGGSGDDTLMAGLGNDTIHFARGDGVDVVLLNQAQSGQAGLSAVVFGDGIRPDDVQVRIDQYGDRATLILELKDGGGRITLPEYRHNGVEAQLAVRFAGGEVWDAAEIRRRPYTGDDAANHLLGSDAKEDMAGRGGDDVLQGLGGNDVLDGGSGNDLLLGGLGDDVLAGGSGGDTLETGGGSDTVRFARGDGRDVLILRDWNNQADGLTTIEFDASIRPEDIMPVFDTYNGTLILMLRGSQDMLEIPRFRYAGQDAPLLVRFADGETWDSASVLQQRYRGDEYGNTLYGSMDDDHMDGRGGHDQLFGGDGNDTLLGGEGDDRLEGGQGDDLLLGGAGADFLQGKEGKDILAGGAGDDLLEAGSGDNIVRFGRGDGRDLLRTVDGGHLGSSYTVELGEGITAADIKLSWDGNGDYGNLMLTINNSSDALLVEDFRSGGTEAALTVRFASGETWTNADLARLLLTGDQYANWIGGWDRDDVITGLGGDDNLHGMKGNDTLLGGEGNDQLFGGEQNDTYNGGTGYDYLRDEGGADTYLFALGDGRDMLHDVRTAAGETNVIRFGAGIKAADLRGYGGGSSVFIQYSATDTIEVRMPESGVTQAPITRFEFADGSTMDWSALFNSAPTVAAPMPNQKLAAGELFSFAVPAGVFVDPDAGDTGRYSTNVLPAWLKFDPLTGVFSGMAPSTLGLQSLKLTFTDRGGLAASTTFNVEVYRPMAMTLTGTSADNVLVGKDGNDTLNGLAGNDTLDGGTGRDQLFGGIGNDTYIVDNIGDVVVERAGEGVDGVRASASHVLTANVENLTLTGTAAINATGNTLNNALYGNSGANRIDGGLGADQMQGGAGNDTYIIDNGGDGVIELAGGGIDLLVSGVSRQLGAHQEHLKLTGGATFGAGNELNNLIQGNNLANSLYGEKGNDILQGGAGDDVLIDDYVPGNGLLDGGAGFDRLTGSAGNEMFIGGAFQDLIQTGGGADILAFNQGDGRDMVTTRSGADDTVSLGRGITYGELGLTRAGDDLVLLTGGDEQITFVNWYGADGARSVRTLQVVTQGGPDYQSGSGNKINDQAVEQFDFAGLVARFDQYSAGQTGTVSWGMQASLAEFHITAASGGAIGGDLAYLYATEGSLASVGAQAALEIIGSPQFGIAAQALQPGTILNDGSTMLL